MSRGKKNKDRAAVWTCSVQSCQSTGFFLGGGKRGGLELVVLLALIVKGTALGAALVQLGDDWGGNVLDLLLGRLEVVSVGIVVLREPLDLLLNSLLDGVLSSSLSLPPSFSSSLSWFLRPLTSISKVTSIWGTPRGAGGMLLRSNLPRRWLSFVMGRSPSKTWMVTVGWLSAAVEKIWDFFVGTTELRSMSLVMTPPTVSIPRVRGLTSRSTRSPVSSSPERTPPWTAAP